MDCLVGAAVGKGYAFVYYYFEVDPGWSNCDRAEAWGL